jgi:hypothetical protein
MVPARIGTPPSFTETWRVAGMGLYGQTIAAMLTNDPPCSSEGS